MVSVSPLTSYLILAAGNIRRQARRQYRRVSERPNKGNKATERETISTYQVAQSLGFHGDFRAWEHLLRIHE